MPQMSPMSWMMLMITFIVTIMAINSIMYFTKMYNNKMKKKMIVNKNIEWKW